MRASMTAAHTEPTTHHLEAIGEVAHARAVPVRVGDHHHLAAQQDEALRELVHVVLHPAHVGVEEVGDQQHAVPTTHFCSFAHPRETTPFLRLHSSHSRSRAHAASLSNLGNPRHNPNTLHFFPASRTRSFSSSSVISSTRLRITASSYASSCFTYVICCVRWGGWGPRSECPCVLRLSVLGKGAASGWALLL